MEHVDLMRTKELIMKLQVMEHVELMRTRELNELEMYLLSESERRLQPYKYT